MVSATSKTILEALTDCNLLMNAETKAPFTQLNFQPIDEDHQLFIEHIASLEASGNADFPRLFADLMAQIQAHFERENSLMERS